MAKQFRLRGFDPVLFVFHLLFLLLSYSIWLAPYIAPSTFPYFGLVPIFYPLILIANLFLLIVLFFRKKLIAIIFAVFSIGLLPPMLKSYQFFGEKPTVEADFKILTFNVHYLKNDGFADFFKNENADIVLLQEVYRKRDEFLELKKDAFSDYYYESNSFNQVFSKYPIIEFRPVFQGENGTAGFAAYADLDIGHDTIRVINVYLEPMKVEKELIKEGLADTDAAKKNSKVLGKKLSTGFLRHQKQIQQLMPFIQHSPHPVILAGDLNAVPNSYEYRQLTYWLKDPYIVTGRAAGTSFHDFKFPLRIDYVLHSKEFQPVSYKVLNQVKLSDHYPVVAEFKLP